MKILIMLILMAGVASVPAKETDKDCGLAGKVTNNKSEPLYMAIVRIYKGGSSKGATTTDDDGKYSFAGLQAGTYDSVTIRIMSCIPKTITNVILEEDKITDLDIVLNIDPQAKTLNESVVVQRKHLFNKRVSAKEEFKNAAGNGGAYRSQSSAEVISKSNKANIAGARGNGTVYYVDGVKASGKMNLPQNRDGDALTTGIPAEYADRNQEEFNTEEYGSLVENAWKKVKDEALSTFSIDVDAASYSNIRRFLSNGQLPPKDAVRIEEMVNYFKYDYPQPKEDEPFSITNEVTVCPWNKKHQLVMIGMQGKTIAMDKLPATNLTFLIDVSGSMDEPNKLPLVKASLKMLTEQMRDKDRIAIVVYAGNAGLVLPSTPGNQKEKIIEALDKLEAGGSTAGGAGIQLAYKIAKENFMKEGNNRVILATDGDFNVGASSDGELVRIIEEKRKDNIFLTVLGFGMGNYKDEKMEQLADKGNGNHAYIDNLMEAKKVLVNEFGGTLFTIAKDVKLQLEWNPANVKSYRLIGYENRMLNKEDFNDDKKDAGELGSGHTVTALYEIIPAGSEEEVSTPVEPLKYQAAPVKEPENFNSEIMTVKLRYKKPSGDISKLLEFVLNKPMERKSSEPSENMRWASTVAGFGMILRDSKYKGDITLPEVLTAAKAARGTDEQGYRAEFIRLVEMAQLYAKK